MIKKTSYLLLCTCVAGSAYAGGYRVALQGQKALGMAHTGVAMTDSAEAIFFNPGAITQIEADNDFTGGVTLLDGKTEYVNEETGTQFETDTPLGTPINAYFSQRISEQMSWGFGVYTPYGNKVEWPTDWAGSHLVNHIELQALYLQPTIAYQFSENTSVGFGPSLILGSVEFNRNLTTSLTDEDGNRSNVTVEAENVPAWGFNLGLLHKFGDKTRFGASYRSESIVEARGEKAKFRDIPTALEDTFSDTEFDADLPLPAELTLGVSHDFSDKLTLSFDFNRTYWSVYDELVIKFDNDVPDSVNPRNYEDSSIYRFGLQYRQNEKWTWRAGIYFDESPVPEGSFAPETPRTDGLGYTAGLTYQATKNLELDASLLILTFEDEENSYDHYQEFGTTIPFGGIYDSVANGLGLGLRYTF